MFNVTSIKFRNMMIHVKEESIHRDIERERDRERERGGGEESYDISDPEKSVHMGHGPFLFPKLLTHSRQNDSAMDGSKPG